MTEREPRNNIFHLTANEIDISKDAYIKLSHEDPEGVYLAAEVLMKLGISGDIVPFNNFSAAVLVMYNAMNGIAPKRESSPIAAADEQKADEVKDTMDSIRTREPVKHTIDSEISPGQTWKQGKEKVKIQSVDNDNAEVKYTDGFVGTLTTKELMEEWNRIA